MLRVIAGKYRSRILEQPALDVTRPLQDIVKGALFSMIQFEIENTIVLDLFAGSGAISIEFVSRGAMKAIAIEQNPTACGTIERNLTKLGINNVTVMRGDVMALLPRLANTQYDFIFMDPPYALPGLCTNALAEVAKLKLLKPTGKVLIAISDVAALEIPRNMMLLKHKTYRQTHLLVITNIL